MAVFKCKMCGGQLEVKTDETVCTCEYCGTEQTLPKLDSEKKTNLYDRANHFRRNNDYDKAMGIYEKILEEDSTDSEAYWSLVLCKYGIEYVEDPKTHKRVPTINRTQYTSIFADENYQSALKNADTLQKSIYENEAKTIDDIQKQILAISAKEEAFDIFICYKESNEKGERTPDSVIANELYYELVKEEINKSDDVSYETRKKLAGKVFNLTSAYDAAISQFLLDEDFPEYLNISYKKSMEMRYGENSHQKAAYYIDNMSDGAMKDFKQLNGKELSYNNIRDMDLAWKVVSEFDEICCCAVKHSTPCGVALGDNVEEAYKKAYETDPVSIFGGIVAFNREVDEASAKLLNEIFLEIIIAPSFSSSALEILSKKKNIRLIECKDKPSDKKELIKVDGGILVQDTNNRLYEDLEVVTKTKPTSQEEKDLIFALKVVKFVKSNAIVVAKNLQTLGIGGGEVSRIWAAEKALERAKERFNATDIVLSSDAFFPFKDVVELAAKNGVKAIIQPSGSVNDKDSIEECDKNNISMIFSKLRHFKH